MALAALETASAGPSRRSPTRVLWFGGPVRDDKPGGLGKVDMYRSFVQSCEPYYYILANDMGGDRGTSSCRTSASGELTGIDIQGESRGLLRHR